MSATIHLVAGVRPNFMKIGPLYHALKTTTWAKPIFVNTGQHSDPLMSDVFLTDIALPKPDIHLGAARDGQSHTTADVLVSYEKVCRQSRPDWVVVVGDVDSTFGAAYAAKKLCLPVAHLEAGLRSFDRSMPEEINRILTDAISDLLWTPSEDADLNLLREGAAKDSIVRVGNVMIDSYEMLAPAIRAARVPDELGLEAGKYGVVTLHRPANVDDRNTLSALMTELQRIASNLPIIFPVHPRTRATLARMGRGFGQDGKLRLIEPMSYIRFMSLLESAAIVMTDSGGVQEETSYLGIPCLTIRASTERPITITHGTNELVRADNLVERANGALKRPREARPSIPLWDGLAAQRVVASLKERVN